MERKNNKLLISSSAKSTIKDSAELAKELDLGLEISRLPFYSRKDITTDEVIQILKNYLENFHNRITVHAMFSDVNIAGKDPLLTEIGRLRFKQSFDTAKALGADTVLFHTGNKGTLHYLSQENFKKNFISFWKDFIKDFERDNIVAVIENVFELTPDYCLELFKGVGSDNFKLALDVGHVNLYSHKTNVIDWIKKYGENLYHMHLHNNFRENDDHSNFDNGTLNFEEILTYIKNSNINPSFVLEMFTEEDIRKSVKIFNYINRPNKFSR